MVAERFKQEWGGTQVAGVEHRRDKGAGREG